VTGSVEPETSTDVYAEETFYEAECARGGRTWLDPAIGPAHRSAFSASCFARHGCDL
jgi:hypothetical protein